MGSQCKENTWGFLKSVGNYRSFSSKYRKILSVPKIQAHLAKIQDTGITGRRAHPAIHTVRQFVFPESSLQGLWLDFNLKIHNVVDKKLLMRYVYCFL